MGCPLLQRAFCIPTPVHLTLIRSLGPAVHVLDYKKLRGVKAHEHAASHCPARRISLVRCCRGKGSRMTDGFRFKEFFFLASLENTKRKRKTHLINPVPSLCRFVARIYIPNNLKARPASGEYRAAADRPSPGKHS